MLIVLNLFRVSKFEFRISRLEHLERLERLERLNGSIRYLITRSALASTFGGIFRFLILDCSIIE